MKFQRLVEKGMIGWLVLFLVNLWVEPGWSDELMPDSIEFCSPCHGSSGVGDDPNVPVIGGQPRTFLVYALKAYAAGDWPSPVMEAVAKGLTEDQIQMAADHYSRQPFRPQLQQVDPCKAEEGKKIHQRLCAKCHVEEGRVADEYEAILVGQRISHLQRVLKQYLRGERAAEKMMLKKLGKLGAEEVDALIAYYGRGK